MPLLPIILPLACAVVAIPASPDAPVPAESGFVLAAGIAQPATPVSDARAPALVAPMVRAPFEPVLALQPRARGPLVEVGALGGGKDWAPGLVHVALDWQF